MTKPRVLLTGRSGFTGRYVARELELAGYEVFGLSNHADDGEPNSIRANLLDCEAVHHALATVKPDVVLHLAAIAFVAHGDVDEMYRVNVVGTHNLLGAVVASAYRPSLVVLASSANIYGNAEIEPIDEDTPPAPVNDYAVSKLAMEYMARLWMDRLPIVITRPFNYTGVGQSEQFLIPKIVAHFRSGKRVIELGNMDVARDFSDVRDVARAYVAIVKAAPAGAILNICSGVSHSLREVLQMMSEITDRQIEVRINPAFVRSNDVARLVGSHSRLAVSTGWRAHYTLQQTLAWQYSEDPAS